MNRFVFIRVTEAVYRIARRGKGFSPASKLEFSLTRQESMARVRPFTEQRKDEDKV